MDRETDKNRLGIFHGIKYGLPLSLILWGIIVMIIFTCSGCTVPARYTDFKGHGVVLMDRDAVHAECTKVKPAPVGYRVDGCARWTRKDRKDCTIILPLYYSQSLKDHEMAHCEGTIRDDQ